VVVLQPPDQPSAHPLAYSLILQFRFVKFNEELLVIVVCFGQGKYGKLSLFGLFIKKRQPNLYGQQLAPYRPGALLFSSYQF